MSGDAPGGAQQRGDLHGFSGRDLALLLVMNLIWGLNLIASKIGVAQIPPVLFTAMRFGALGLLLLPLLRVHRGQMKNLIGAAVFTGPLSFALLFVGVFRVEDASMVAIASQMGVPFSTLLSVWLLGETIRWRRRFGIVLAFGGIAIIGFDPRAFAYWDGLALVVVSCFIASLGLIYVKRLQGIGALALQAWIGIVGGPTLLLFSLLTETGQIQAIVAADWRAWAALFFTTVMSSLVAHTTWYYLISRYPVTSLAPLTLLAPLFGVFFGVTLLNDQLTWRMMLGAAITLVGVLIVLIREKRLIDTGT
jgi:O-acetylserine/cysteine efflux transporter